MSSKSPNLHAEIRQLHLRRTVGIVAVVTILIAAGIFFSTNPNNAFTFNLSTELIGAGITFLFIEILFGWLQNTTDKRITELENTLRLEQASTQAEIQEVRAEVRRLSNPKEIYEKYGYKCAFCELDGREFVEVARLRPATQGGDIEPENCLVLCPSHHRVLDSGHIRIHPSTLALYIQQPDTFDTLHIKYKDITHLPFMPAKENLEFLWRQKS